MSIETIKETLLKARQCEIEKHETCEEDLKEYYRGKIAGINDILNKLNLL